MCTPFQPCKGLGRTINNPKFQRSANQRPLIQRQEYIPVGKQQQEKLGAGSAARRFLTSMHRILSLLQNPAS
jgi:hypothetical protein